MPSYTYSCDKHGEFTITKSISDETPAECPICKTTEVKRIYAATGYVAKCDGFYGKSSK